MRTRLSCICLLICCLYSVSIGEDQREIVADAEVREVFSCGIYLAEGRPRVRVIESAEDYAALRKKISEITWPTPGVRRPGSKTLRKLGEFDFEKNRLVLICNRSMAEDIRLVKADSKEIHVRNVSTGAAAINGSAHLIALAVKRGPHPPRVSWASSAPGKR